MIDLSEDPLLNKDLRYLVVLQLSFRNPLLQELLPHGVLHVYTVLLLSGTRHQTPWQYKAMYLTSLASVSSFGSPVCYIMPVGVHIPLQKYLSGDWQLLPRDAL